jgi:hypothetical protein
MDDLHAHSSGCPSLIVRAESALGSGRRVLAAADDVTWCNRGGRFAVNFLVILLDLDCMVTIWAKGKIIPRISQIMSHPPRPQRPHVRAAAPHVAAAVIVTQPCATGSARSATALSSWIHRLPGWGALSNSVAARGTRLAR